ncbi:polymorphic toxin type 17 domain-containing protein, partial [Bacillus safensis]
DIRVINDKLYNVKGIKKLKEFDIADEVVTDPSAIDYIGGRYTVYANKQIIRTYIVNDEVRIEEVDNIPASRSHGNVKRILDGEVVSTAENIILEYSGIYDGYRAVTGKDPETNQNISNTDQALSAVSIIPLMKIIKGGKYVFKIDQGKNVVKRVERGTNNDAYGGYYKRKQQRKEDYQNNISNPMTKANLPNKGSFRFIPGGEVKLNKQLDGYVDKFGNVWVKGPYHGDPSKNFQFEWDVQLSEKGMKEWGKYTKNSKKYINVAPDGTLSH